MPTERSDEMPERDWAILTGLIAGQTVAEVAKSVGVSRQGCYMMLRRAERLLLTQRDCDPPT